VFEVSNRSKDRYFLPYMTTLQAIPTVDAENVNGTWFNETAFDVRAPLSAFPSQCIYD
jgi:hypothetical protein